MPSDQQGFSRKNSITNLLRSVYRFFIPREITRIQKKIHQEFAGKESVFFVQVGANDGYNNDCLHSFIITNKNWNGILIEPVKFIFDQLKETYAIVQDNRLIFENVAISSTGGSQSFYYVAPNANEKEEFPIHCYQLGSFDKQHILKHLQGRLAPYIIEEKIETATISEVLNRNNVSCLDLLHIDVEGYDFKVLSTLDFSAYPPKMIIYEHKHLTEEEYRMARSLLAKHQYAITEYKENTLALRRGKN